MSPTPSVAGVSDFGNFGVMPLRKVPDSSLVASYGVFFHSKYSHQGEVAIPGFYSALLEDANTTAEMTAAGTHAGIHRCVNHGWTSGGWWLTMAPAAVLCVS